MDVTPLFFFFFLIIITRSPFFVFFFFNDTATTEIYTLSLHDALPISDGALLRGLIVKQLGNSYAENWSSRMRRVNSLTRSEEHTSELQSLAYLVCRLLLEKKKITTEYHTGA